MLQMNQVESSHRTTSSMPSFMYTLSNTWKYSSKTKKKKAMIGEERIDYNMQNKINLEHWLN